MSVKGQEVGAVVVVTAIAGAVVAARSWRRAWVEVVSCLKHVQLHCFWEKSLREVFLSMIALRRDVRELTMFLVL